MSPPPNATGNAHQVQVARSLILLFRVHRESLSSSRRTHQCEQPEVLCVLGKLEPSPVVRVKWSPRKRLRAPSISRWDGWRCIKSWDGV